MGERSRAALVILLVSGVLMLPLALGPERVNDSFWIDWVWLDQFARQVAAGDLYPRWLPLSHGGLGSPVFIYYPPLSFHLGSLFVLAGTSTWGGVVGAFWAALAGSGLAMWRWLLALQARRPLAGALLFMAAPYHLINLTARGALAEFAATALLPLLALGLLWCLREGGRRGPVTLALAYGALIMTHLPVALLASLFLVGPWLVWEIRTRAAWTRAAPALAIGIGLAAIFLFPALALEGARDAAELWADPKYQPRNWTLWAPGRISAGAFLLFGSAAVASAWACGMLLLDRRSVLAAGALLLSGLAVGLVPWLWQAPLLQAVQFPFRLLTIVEFLVATAVALAPLPTIRLVIAVTPWLSLAIVHAQASSRTSMKFEQVARDYPDVPENLPPGEWPYSWPSDFALQLARRHAGPVTRNGVTLEPRFYFPGVEVRCKGRAVPAFMDPGTGLLAHHGTGGCGVTEVRTQPERVGNALTLAALLALLVWCWKLGKVDARRGFEPRLTESESVVLPLDDRARA